MVACLRVFLLALLVTLSTQLQHKLTVFYDACETESRDFYRQQVYPTYLALYGDNPPGIMSLELVPYLNISLEPRWRYGPSSPAWLYANLQICAAKYANSESRKFAFFDCLMTRSDCFSGEYSNWEYCAVNTCIDDVEMSVCMNNVDGNYLLTGNVNRTESLPYPPPISLPMVTFNDVYHADEQAKARINLLALVCDKISALGSYTDACQKWSAWEPMKATKLIYSIKKKCHF